MIWVKRHLCGQLTIEPLTIIRHFIDPKDICLDIGAHTGTWTIPLSKLCEHVYAFEALPYYNNVLQMTIRLFQRKNITLLNKAVANQTGQINMIWQDEQLSRKSVNARKELNSLSITVEGVTLDDFLVQQQLQTRKISFIKIDIEGAELLALQGATQLITQFQPVIYLEICEDYCQEYGHSAQDVLTLLATQHYQAMLVKADLTIRPINTQDYSGQGNVLFIPNNRLNQFNELFKSYLS